MQDIKDIATMMGTQFADAVKLSEKRDAEEIESILKGLNDIYHVFMSKQEEILKRKATFLEKVEECYENEALIQTEYNQARAPLIERLEAFRMQKLGTKVSDETVAQRARANGLTEGRTV